MCMRSDTVGYAAQHGEILRELEDKLDMIQIQKQILDTLTTAPPRNINAMQIQEAIKSLNLRLLNVNQLYSDYAENFDLWEAQLTILNSSNHNEPRLINSILSHIFDNELNAATSLSEKAQRLLSKVQSLANDFGVGPCFPLCKFI